MKKCVAILAPSEGWEPICRPYADKAEFVFVPLFVSLPIDNSVFSNFIMDLSLAKYDCVVLTCPTAVRHSINMAIERGLLNRFLTSMSKVEVIVIGDRSAETAKWNGLKVPSVSSEASTSSLIEHINALPHRGSIALLRSDRGSRLLPSSLIEAGWNVTEVPVYSLQLKRSEDMEVLLDRLEDNEVSTLAFATPSHADAFFFHLKERFEGADANDVLDGVTIAVLSNDTKDKLEEYGLKVDIMPKRATAELMVKDIVSDL
ncbi:uroporphyrinogen-III synthase [Methanomassiliicoccus luminyensis]|uniref:uroporphyrinogen-III synthase n=1 Tax=Methanomassiliicoccus luminyensis TaxID=1080712 RepID=UPI00037DECBE|nr:uroporphyrinogen-III synthase [Methanomassiliicoccus luminyensis]